MHELVYMMRLPPFCAMLPVVTYRWGKVGQTPFAPAIARCYLAILSIKYDLSHKLDFEAVAIVAI